MILAMDAARNRDTVLLANGSIPPWGLSADTPNPYFECGVYSNGTTKYPVRMLASMTVGRPVISVHMNKLSSMLYEPVWSDGCIPMDVIKAIVAGHDHQYQEHTDRILYANTSYPLIVDQYYNVLDGYHRLAKHYIASAITVDCVMLFRDDLREASRLLYPSPNLGALHPRAIGAGKTCEAIQFAEQFIKCRDSAAESITTCESITARQ